MRGGEDLGCLLWILNLRQRHVELHGELKTAIVRG
jgi:hypothetical protein